MSKMIRVSDDTYGKISKRGKFGETANDVIGRLMSELEHCKQCLKQERRIKRKQRAKRKQSNKWNKVYNVTNETMFTM